jgi:uncharacterized membrane protein YphA (DoxX/SURF4 family)
MNMTNRSQASTVLWILKISYGLFYIVVGIDKYLNMVTNWAKYVHPAILETTNLQAAQLNMGMGVMEIAVGLMMLTKWPRLAAGLMIAALGVIALDLALLGYYDIAARDVLLAVGPACILLLSDDKK